MMKAPELETQAVDMDELDDYITQADTCNGFAFWYAENHEDAVVKDAFVEGGDAHCYVYDAERDVTIDPTLGQFSGKPRAGAWDGDHHPYVAEWEEIREWEDPEAFAEHYSGVTNSPFIV